MYLRILLGAVLSLGLVACGGGGGGGGSGSSSSSINENITGATVSGQIDLAGATLEGTLTVSVNGNAGVVSATIDPDVFDWTATFVPSSTYTDYRVEYFSDGNLIGAVDYSVDP